MSRTETPRLDQLLKQLQRAQLLLLEAGFLDHLLT